MGKGKRSPGGSGKGSSKGAGSGKVSSHKGAVIRPPKDSVKKNAGGGGSHTSDSGPRMKESGKK